MKLRAASLFFTFAFAAVTAQAQSPTIESLASDLVALTARVAKLEGQIVAADLEGARADQPSIFLPDSARVYDIGRGEARILVGAEQSGGTWWLGRFRNDPGRFTALHVHHSADEQFYALEGVVSVWVAGSWHDLPPGALAVVPRGTPHALGNRTKQAVHFLNSGNPAGFERFFADIETTARHFPTAVLSSSPS